MCDFVPDFLRWYDVCVCACVFAVFFKFMVLPLFNLWHRFLDTKLSHSMMDNLRKNQQQWEDLRRRENSEEPALSLDGGCGGSDASRSSAQAGPASAADDDMMLLDVPEPVHGRRGSLPAVMLETVDKMGRRHSVPLNLARATAAQVPCTILRRDSAGGAAAVPSSALQAQADNRRRFTLGQIPYLEEEEEGLSVSLGSSRSSGLQRSSDGGGQRDDRPVSAENLIPEPSIATITNPAEASRLCTVIHGVTSPTLQQQVARGLTRQQTFPPIQPYVRARYLSTGGNSDLAPCSSSSGGTSAVSTASSRTGSTSSEGGCGAAVAAANGTKRDSALDCCTDRVFKLARFSKEKENVDPATRANAEIRRNSNHVNQVRTDVFFFSFPLFLLSLVGG